MSEKKNILLIIEDEKSLLDALKDKFKLEGFEVLTAENGEQGLTEAVKKEPDIILLDILMPKMDGLTMLKKLRDDGWAKGTPVIILTNVNDLNQIAKAVENLAQAYLIKADWKIEDVVKLVKEKLNMK